MKAFTLFALVAPTFAEELLARGGGGGGGDWGYGDKTTKVTYTTSKHNAALGFLSHQYLFMGKRHSSPSPNVALFHQQPWCLPFDTCMKCTDLKPSHCLPCH